MDYALLEKMCTTYGVSGAEGEVRKIIQKLITPYVDEVFVDKMGNLIAHKFGTSPKVMLAAHMDEVGLMVKNIEDDGKIRFSAVGFVEPLAVVGQRVGMHPKKAKTIHGIITTNEIGHMQAVKNIPKIEEMFVETGMKKKELERMGVNTGTYITLSHTFLWLGKHRLSGKALDDRIGCLVLVELAKRLQKNPNELYYVFTVQEEMGLYGAKTSAYTIQPDWAIVVDVSNTDNGKTGSSKKIGGGPTLTVMDAELIANTQINRWVIDTARKLKINLQLDLSEEGTSDAVNILISRSGIPSTVMGVPVANLHSTIGIAHKRDIEQLLVVLETLFKKAPIYGEKTQRPTHMKMPRAPKNGITRKKPKKRARKRKL